VGSSFTPSKYRNNISTVPHLKPSKSFPVYHSFSILKFVSTLHIVFQLLTAREAIHKTNIQGKTENVSSMFLYTVDKQLPDYTVSSRRSQLNCNGA
jgi:hypothetical protein